MFWRSTWPAFLWASFVLLLCGLPGDDFPALTFLEWLRPDKIVHLILFGTQCFLLIKGFKKQNSFYYLKEHSKLIAIIVSIAYGALVEVLQTYVFIHRSGDVRDAAANALGAFIGAWIVTKTQKRKPAN